MYMYTVRELFSMLHMYIVATGFMRQLYCIYMYIRCVRQLLNGISCMMAFTAQSTIYTATAIFSCVWPIVMWGLFRLTPIIDTCILHNNERKEVQSSPWSLFIPKGSLTSISILESTPFTFSFRVISLKWSSRYSKSFLYGLSLSGSSSTSSSAYITYTIYSVRQSKRKFCIINFHGQNNLVTSLQSLATCTCYMYIENRPFSDAQM